MQSHEQLMEFLNFCIDYVGLSFHPDNDFNEYLDVRNNEKLFSDSEIEIYNNKMLEAFEYCENNDLDIYEICFNLF